MADDGPSTWDVVKAQAADMYDAGKAVVSGTRLPADSNRNLKEAMAKKKPAQAATRLKDM